MATFLIVTQSNSGLTFRPAVAANITALEATIETALKGSLATGLPRYLGQPSLDAVATNAPASVGTSVNDGEMLIGIVQLEAGTKLVPGVNPQVPVANWNNRMQPAIADLPAFTVTSVAQANTAIQAIRAAFNTLLAELRTVGVVAP